MATDDDDKRVKDMLGETNLVDLQRWFGLPSYTELEETGKAAALPEEDPYREAREQRDRALAAVDPKFFEAILERHKTAWTLLTFEQTIDVRVRVDMGLFDETMATTRTTADPREIERPEDIEDQLHENAPQALLRDLHRAESTFEIQYEIYDAEARSAGNPLDEVALMMKTDHKLKLDALPGTDLKVIMADSIGERTHPWSELPKRNRMVNRRITE